MLAMVFFVYSFLLLSMLLAFYFFLFVSDALHNVFIVLDNGKQN